MFRLLSATLFTAPLSYLTSHPRSFFTTSEGAFYLKLHVIDIILLHESHPRSPLCVSTPPPLSPYTAAGWERFVVDPLWLT